jgi:hypothetical protein
MSRGLQLVLALTWLEPGDVCNDTWDFQGSWNMNWCDVVFVS